MSHDNRLIPSKWKDVTPSDTAFHNIIGFRVGTAAGNVTVEYADGTSFTHKNVQVGEKLESPCVRVKATGTTATGIEGAVS